MANTILIKNASTGTPDDDDVVEGELLIHTGNRKLYFGDASDELSTFLINNGDWSGTDLSVANGGTGASTLTSNYVLLGNGTSSPQMIAPGSDGNVLTSNGTTWQSEAAAGGGSDAFTLKVDAAATAGYLGVAYSDGILRTTQNEIDVVDGGNYITLGLSDHDTARTALGLAIGSDVQAYDSNNATTSTNWSAADITSGTLAVARGGTALTSLSTLLNSNVTPTSLSLVIGTDVQAYNANIATTSTNWSAADITSGTLAVARGGTALTSLSTLLNSNVTSVSGNAGTATALATGRTIGMTGDVVWTSASFTGSGNVTGSATIQSGAIDEAMMADNSVDSDSYVDGSIDAAHIASSAVTTAKINADAVTNAKIADDAVDTENIADDAITAALIDDGAVVAAGLGSSAVTTAKINATAVTQAKIAGEAIDESRLHVSNGGTNGYSLTFQSGNTGKLTWADISGGGGSGLSTDMSDITVPPAINTSLISDTDNTDDLGSSSIYWKDIYFKGSMVTSAGNGLTANYDVGVALLPGGPGMYSLATSQFQFTDGILTRVI